jgi:SMI1-KNR4 cell-wall
MAFESVERHLVELGIAPMGEVFQPIPEETQRLLESAAGGKFPAILRWLFSRFGGFQFHDGVFYFDPRYQRDVMLGWFSDADELSDTFESFREALPTDMFPIANDGGDNLLCAGVGPSNNGAVFFHVHDAGRGDDGGPASPYRVSDSLEEFLLSLHREE